MAIDWWYGLVGYQRPRSYPRSWVTQYAQAPQLARLAEDAGFKGFFLTEHHCWYDGYVPSLLPTLAGIARHTKRIRIGTGVLLLPLHDPLRVAEDIAVVDNLTNGRLDIGIGVGYRPEEFLGFNSEKKTRGVRSREGMRFLKKLLTEETCTWEGKHYQYKDIRISPRPLQRPPPIWYGTGQSEKTAIGCAKSGINVWLPAVNGIDAMTSQLQIYYKTAAQAGFDPASLSACSIIDVAIAETRAQAWRIVQEYILPMWVEQIIGFGFLTDADGNPLRELKPGDPAYEGLVGSFVWGTPDDVCRRLQPLIELGFSHFMPRLYGAAWDMKTLSRSIELFSERVMPYFG